MALKGIKVSTKTFQIVYYLKKYLPKRATLLIMYWHIAS